MKKRICLVRLVWIRGVAGVVEGFPEGTNNGIVVSGSAGVDVIFAVLGWVTFFQEMCVLN